MDQVLVKVRDFAQRCGCTPQNIYGHLRTYAADLEGHTFPGKGRQGILLDDYAQDFLRSVMYPKDLAENVLQTQINELRGQLMAAETERLRLGSLLVKTEAERDRALMDVGQYQKRLKASERAEETTAAELQAAQEKLAAAHDAFEEELQKKEQAIEEMREKIEAEKEKNAALMKRGLLDRIFNKGVD